MNEIMTLVYRKLKARCKDFFCNSNKFRPLEEVPDYVKIDYDWENLYRVWNEHFDPWSSGKLSSDEIPHNLIETFIASISDIK